MLLEDEHPADPVILHCNQCSKSFEKQEELLLHNDLEHKKETIYQCNHCPKTYNTKKSLSQHQSRYHRGQIWRCVLCDKYFQRKQNLSNHMNLHTNEAKTKKEDVSRAEKLRRQKKIITNFNSQIPVLPLADRRKLLKDIVNENQEALDMYGDYPLDEDDVTEMVRDVNLSDRQVLKVLSIIRKKWGNNKVTPNIQNY